MRASKYIRFEKSVTKRDSTYYRYARILKFMREHPSLIDFITQLLHVSYGTDDLKFQPGLIHVDSRNLFPLEDLNAQFFLRATNMNVKNSKRTGRFSTVMFYSKYVSLRNDQ